MGSTNAQRASLLLSILFVFSGLASSGEVFDRARPYLVDDVRGKVTRLWVEVEGGDRAITGHLLRTTSNPIVPGSVGSDPTGSALFVTWTEGDDQRWSAFSRDGGATWSEPRPNAGILRLRDSATRPADATPFVSPDLRLAPDGRLFIVQFHTISLPEWRKGLAESGAEILAFFPDNAHLSRMSESAREQVEALEFVQRIEPYHPAYRIEPELRDWLDGAAGGEEMRVRVMVFEWGPTAKQRVRSAAESNGARIAQYWPSGHVLELWVDRDQLRSLAGHDDVMWIDRWSAPETDMDLVREDAGIDWVEDNLGFCGQGVHGEVMDNGIDDNHPDLDLLKLHTPSGEASHGTSTYGIVWGNGDRDGDGDAAATGHMPCPQSRGYFAANSVADRYAHTEELKGPPYFASFQSNSWGSNRTTSYTSTSAGMDDIIWRLDIAITQSQSNAGNQNSRPQAWAKNIISVGGIRHYNTLDPSDDAWAFGASIGPAEDGRIKPDVNYWYDSVYTTTLGGGYTNFGGTSAATPEVAGILGIVAQMWAENVWGTDPQGATVFEKQPHASTFKALLINNAQQYDFAGASDDLTRTHQGWGRPSARIAYDRAATSFIVDENYNLALGQTQAFDVFVPENETELKITMVYPDPPGTTSATLHRINDVDLRVTSPGGDLYHGNYGLGVSTHSTPGGSPNSVDTVENVFVNNPESGTWTVEIEAVEVNQDAVLASPETDVTFALVVTGAGLPGECGNGLKELGEECDGDDLGGATCEDAFCSEGGVIGCTSECALDTTLCDGCPVCGDGTCEGNETIDDCAIDCVSGTPGEAATTTDLLVVSFDPGTGTMTFVYGPACDAQDHVIEYGDLTAENLAAYAWSGQECALGSTGSYAWSVDGLPESIFFVIVGRDSLYEGSYGTDSTGAERSEDVTSATCPLPQNLTLRCD
jgi:hypothetical protein